MVAAHSVLCHLIAATVHVYDLSAMLQHVVDAGAQTEAEIRRIKDRIESLKKHQEQPNKEATGDGWKMYEDNDAGRICFEFDGKPERETIDLLKHNGFKWAPSIKRWQRQNTDNGRRAAENVAKAL